MCDLKQLRSLFGAGSCFCGLAPLLLTVPAAARLSSALAQASPRSFTPPGLLSTGLSRGLAPQAGCITTLWASAQCTRPVSRRPLQGPSPRLRGSSTRPHTPLA